MLDDAPRVIVPVLEVVVAAYRSVFGRIGLVLELGWLPLLIMLAALLVPGLVLRYVAAVPVPAAPADAFLDLGDLAEAMITMLCLNAFAVRWHRLMLTGDVAAAPPRAFGIAWARFCVYTLAIYAAAIGLTAAMAFSGMFAATSDAAFTAAKRVVAVISGLALSLAIARLSLLFPAAAYGAPLGPRQAWLAMGGNSWRLVGASFLVVMPIIIVIALLLGQLLAAAHLGPPRELAANPPLGVFLLSGVLETVLRLVLVALGASVLAEFYRRIVLH
jgi:hypothetical protein